MSYMFEVYYKSPVDPVKEAALTECVARFGGRFDFKEGPGEHGPANVCLTYEFDEAARAEAAAESLRRHGEYVEGPMVYGA
jgi:hypothetical protein